MKIAIIVGSTQKESVNKKLAAFIQSRYAERADMEILPIEQLPMYNQDEELDPPAIVKEIKQKVKESDGVMMITPEYNHSVPGVLKNAIDWFSRVDRVMVKKPVMIAGASPGVLGTARAQMHLRQILNSPGIAAFVMPGNEVFISTSHQKIDQDGNVTDEATVQFLDTVMKNFIEWIEKTDSL